MTEKWWAKVLRIAGIVLMSLTAVFTLMGGIGTTCVTLNPTGFGGKFAAIEPFQWLWIIFVLAGIIAGVLGIRAVVMLIKGTKGAYLAALTTLILGTVINAAHLFASRALRGASMPVDGVLYANVLTLIVFLLFLIPGIWQNLHLEKPSKSGHSDANAAAISLAFSGVMILTIQFLMRTTHSIDGVNYADVWHAQFLVLGGGLILAAAIARISCQPGIQKLAREIKKNYSMRLTNRVKG